MAPPRVAAFPQFAFDQKFIWLGCPYRVVTDAWT